jgi:aspartate/methionine/tyrosine aminotransferase
VDAWVRDRKDVWWVPPDAGFTGFVRLGTPARPLDGDRVARALFERHRVRIVPGSFFQAPAWLRLSYLLEEADLEAALAALGETLDHGPPTRP